MYLLCVSKVATGVAPWIQRASDMKAEVVMNHDMERKVQQHSDEIVKLIKDVKFKVRQRGRVIKAVLLKFYGRTKHFKNPVSRLNY